MTTETDNTVNEAANTDAQSAEKLAKAKELLKELVSAGVHLGHETKMWNPKMAEYIYDQKDGVHIINLSKTVNNLMKAADLLKKYTRLGKNVVFVGTSKQCSYIIKEEAERAGAFYINQRWLGGLITNFDTIRGRLGKLREYENAMETGAYEGYGKKELARINRQILKLNKSIGGLKKMRGRPEVLIVFDQNKDSLAITEAKKVGVNLIAVTDTDCDPSDIDVVIPANDDSMRSIKFLSKFFADAIEEAAATAKKRR